ncbi:NAD-dependent epimerase/dehydratase family protein [Bacillus sp. P14.5]|uniref:NAD-dependent epimerase/dehydratase family protein n=1 Tax=Bacillus sp. P14.5 TaxID=1983400 RepID=UPI000DE817CB|nr:NAD-dependent epimerase/dehydratase family protein [Bacillus sp. P14.5]
MRILLLGGTSFLGKHIAQSAISKGHEVTLFNRGKTNPHLFPEAGKLTGDRESGDLKALEKGEWDVVIDTSGYTPGKVEQTAALLKERIRRYIFISSISVYKDFQKGEAREEDVTGSLENPDTEEVNGETYGPLKALCEEKLEAILPGKVLNIRPGLIVGPDDTTDRFTYWVKRFSKGGEVLVPGCKERKIQWIDVRDLSQWVILMAEDLETGTYNVTGPKQGYGMKEFVEDLALIAPRDTEAVWVNDSFLVEREITPFTQLPLWIPVNEKYPDGFILADYSRSLKKGLVLRHPRETIEDTLSWLQSHGPEELKAGLTEETEASLLKSWSVVEQPRNNI